MAATQEKIELSEQTPLKSDTDTNAPVVGGAEVAEGADGTKAPAQEKKRWFFNKKGKGDAAKKGEEGEGAEVANSKDGGGESTTPAELNNKGKKAYWWQKKPCHNAEPNDQQQQELSYGINLVQRDDHQLQTDIDFGFDNIYGEPDSVHSLNGVWKTNYAVFQAVRCFFYKLFSFIIAIPLAVIFGILFALLSALSVFLCVPGGKLLSIPAKWIFKVWHFIVHSLFDPIFLSIGYLFSNVKVSRYGLNSDPTAVITA